MGLAIGYNVKKANELMDEISTAYTDLGNYINTEWADVSTTLREHWVGDDEQDFEKNFVERIQILYVDSYNLVKTSTQVIGDLAKSWHEFQKKNTISGQEAANISTISVDVPTITPNDRIIEFVARTLSDADDRGLKDSTSASTIKEKITDFVNGIKKKAEELFNIEANAAFFGEQTRSIKLYVEKVGNTIAQINIAVQDLHNALDQLAGSTYTASEDAATELIDSETTNLESATADLGASRWTSGN